MSEQQKVFSKLAHHAIWDFIISRGIISLIIGILLLTMPGATILTLCLFVGFFLLINGVTTLIKAFKIHEHKAFMISYGLFYLLAGIIILLRPILVEGIFFIIFTIWILITGLQQLITAIKAKHRPKQARILTAITGIISLALGLTLVFYPHIGFGIVIAIIGIYFLSYGILAIGIGALIHKAEKNC